MAVSSKRNTRIPSNLAKRKVVFKAFQAFSFLLVLQNLRIGFSHILRRWGILGIAIFGIIFVGLMLFGMLIGWALGIVDE